MLNKPFCTVGLSPWDEKTLAEGDPVTMWRPAGRLQLGLSLVLGVFAGVTLLLIPALVTPANQASTTETEGLISALSRSDSSTGPETASPASTGTSDKLQLGLGLFLLLLPASVLSFLTRKWAVRKLQQY